MQVVPPVPNPEPSNEGIHPRLKLGLVVGVIALVIVGFLAVSGGSNGVETVRDTGRRDQAPVTGTPSPTNGSAPAGVTVPETPGEATAPVDDGAIAGVDDGAAGIVPAGPSAGELEELLAALPPGTPPAGAQQGTSDNGPSTGGFNTDPLAPGIGIPTPGDAQTVCKTC